MHTPPTVDAPRLRLHLPYLDVAYELVVGREYDSRVSLQIKGRGLPLIANFVQLDMGFAYLLDRAGIEQVNDSSYIIKRRWPDSEALG
jgi:hypothetical protein